MKEHTIKTISKEISTFSFLTPKQREKLHAALYVLRIQYTLLQHDFFRIFKNYVLFPGRSIKKNEIESIPT